MDVALMNIKYQMYFIRIEILYFNQLISYGRIVLQGNFFCALGFKQRELLYF